MGDRALQAAARHIASSIRDNDLLARYGGDEFLVVLAGTDGRIAAEVAERIRGSLAHGRFVVGPGTDIHLTLSAGVVEAQPDQTVTDLLQTVDQHLDRAKRDRNRNRIWAEA